MLTGMKLLAAIAVAATIGTQAEAAIQTIDLTASVADIGESMFDYNGDHYDRFQVSLQGIDSSTGIVVAQGDTVNSTVTFDSAITVAMSAGHTNLLQAFNGTDFTSGNTGSTGTLTLYNAGVQVASFGYGSSTSGQLSSYVALFPPNNTSLTFDSFTNSFTVDTLDQPSTVQYSTFIYDDVSTAPAPEPGEWAMIVAGLGVIGAAARRRRAA